MLSLILENQQLRNENSARLGLRDSLAYYKTKYGSTVAENQSLEVSTKELKQLMQNELKEIRSVVGSINNIQNITKIQYGYNGKVITPLHHTYFVDGADTLPVDTFTYKDNYLALNGAIKQDSVAINYRITDTLEVIQYKKRINWFKKQTYVAVKLRNPNLTITNLQDYQIKEPKKFYNSSAFKVSVGLVSGVLLSNAVFNKHVVVR